MGIICRTCQGICELCSQPINFECIHCGYITDDKLQKYRISSVSKSIK